MREGMEWSGVEVERGGEGFGGGKG